MALNTFNRQAKATFIEALGTALQTAVEYVHVQP